jgi:hypothetical protein
VVSSAIVDGPAGVNLYSGAQQLEPLSRTDADRAKIKDQIEVIIKELSNSRFVAGFGSNWRRRVLLLPEHQRQPSSDGRP